MDALTHATEAYVASARSDFSDPLALKAIQMIIDNLIDSYNGNKVAREKMHIAQCLAGMAFSNALLGITHSLAHKTGAIFHIPHGCANAIYLPYVVRYNQKCCAERYADIAKFLGLKGSTTSELVDSYVELLENLNRKMEIPSTLKEYGVKEGDFKNNLDRIANNAVEDACTGCNPRPTNTDDFKNLLTAIYYGQSVNF
jgi:alcohol dehydrogenase class IV